MPTPHRVPLPLRRLPVPAVLLVALALIVAPAAPGRPSASPPAPAPDDVPGAAPAPAPNDPFMDQLTQCLQDLAQIARTGPGRRAAPREVDAAAEQAARPWDQGLARPRRVALTRLTPELIDLSLEVASDIDRDLGRQLRRLRQRDPDAFEQTLRRSRRLVAMAELKRRDPILYDLKRHELETDAQVSRLAAAVRRARRQGRTSDARALEGQLRMQLTLQIAFRYNTKDDYLCRLRELVDRLERELEHERTHFEETLERRLTELVHDEPRPVAANRDF